MKRFFLFWGALCIYTFGIGQQLSISPYSGIGIGELKFDQNVVLSSMAGTSTTASSQFGSEANFFNPAANRDLSFATFGGTLASDLVNFKGEGGLDSRRSTTYMSELSLAFPITEKIKFGVGFQPFSGVGYKVARIYEENDPVKGIQLEGDGGLNSLHSFVSYNINEKFSVGLRTNYLFGNMSKSQKVAVQNSELISDYNNDTRIHSFVVTPGVMFTQKYDENKFFNLGATYTFKSNFDTKLNYLHSTYYYNSNNEKVNIDTIAHYSGPSGGHLGNQFTIGASLSKNLKYRFAIEGQYYGKPNYEFENEFYQLQNGYKVAFGSWFIPDVNSYKNYFEKMVYRFGTYYQKGTVSVNGNDINQFGITFGFGLPVGPTGFKDPSMLNIGFDLGRRGTQKGGMIQENFANIKIGLNFNDIWFRRKKYN